MARSILFLFLALLSPAFAQAAPAGTPPAILVMGDSLSAGYGIAQSAAWPRLLGEKLSRERYRYEVVNASISGETTSGGRARIDAELRRSKPAIVIIGLGANDGLRGLSLAAMRDNLDAMIHASQQAGAQVLLVGMRMPPNLGRAYTEKFHQTFFDLARERKTALVPFLLEKVALNRNLFLEDGLHPTAKAQPLILETVWPGLKPLLKK